MEKHEIIQILKANKQLLIEQYGITQIGFFGSYVYGAEDDESDIDIAFEISKEKKNLHNFLALKRFLEKQLGKTIDLGFKHSLKPAVSESIQSTIIYV